MSKLYYTPPLDNQFDELKQKAVEIWFTYNDEYGYVTGKVEKIKDLKNVGDNFMYMVAMFDISNQRILAKSLSEDTRLAVRERLVAGGTPEYLNVF